MSDAESPSEDVCSADFCSLTIRTRPARETNTTPLEQYAPKGYVSGEGREAKARDAAVALTASRWGPPFDTPCETAGDWWFAAYDCAASAVERAIVDGVVGV